MRQKIFITLCVLLQQDSFAFFANGKSDPCRNKLQEIGRVQIEFPFLFYGIMYDVKLINGRSKDKGYVLIEEQNQAPPYNGTFYIEKFTTPMDNVRKPLGNKHQDLEKALCELIDLVERS